MKETRPLPLRYDGVIFDMDGTLVEPLLDFAAIRAELGVPHDQGILEALDARPGPERRADHARLLGRELAAAQRADLLPGAAETLAAIRAAGLKTALLTRNARAAMETVLARHALPFDLAWSREDGPIKPEPDGVLRACTALGIAPGRTVCVGDFRYDIQAANDAGSVSVLLDRGQAAAFASEADHVIHSLAELPELLGI
jgi:HAD superfamily hydrolase (TIGR01509 family)